MNVYFWVCKDDFNKKNWRQKRDFCCFSMTLKTVIFVLVQIQTLIFCKNRWYFCVYWVSKFEGLSSEWWQLIVKAMFARLRKLQFFKAVEPCTGGSGVKGLNIKCNTCQCICTCKVLNVWEKNSVSCQCNHTKETFSRTEFPSATKFPLRNRNYSCTSMFIRWKSIEKKLAHLTFGCFHARPISKHMATKFSYCKKQ